MKKPTGEQDADRATIQLSAASDRGADDQLATQSINSTDQNAVSNASSDLERQTGDHVETADPTSESLALPPVDWLQDRNLYFAGKLGGVAKRDARLWVTASQGRVVHLKDPRVDTIVLGADSFPFNVHQLDESVLERVAAGDVLLLEETEFWQRCGFLDRADSLQQLYTPAMLADLLDVPVRQIRRWHRLGLIHPIKEVHRLPYFDFQEVTAARRLVRWLGSESPEVVEKKLAQLATYVPGVNRPLSQLSIIVQGREVLLRQMTGLVEPNGQLRFDFAIGEEEQDEDPLPEIVPFHATMVQEPEVESYCFPFQESEPLTPDDMLQQAIVHEDQMQWEQAIEVYRSMIMAFGPTADLCFQIAELLYRQGDLNGARERYYMAIELDDELVEARANLGCVLADLQQWDLAIATFEGALEIHPDYADVLFHLASALEKLDRSDEAAEYWSRFLQAAPNSPWAPYARVRFSEIRNWSVTPELVPGE